MRTYEESTHWIEEEFINAVCEAVCPDCPNEYVCETCPMGGWADEVGEVVFDLAVEHILTLLKEWQEFPKRRVKLKT